MTADFSTLAAELDAIVRAVPGVSELYASSPAIVTTLRQIAPGSGSATLVDVRKTTEGCAITANIGVLTSIQGPQTAAAVSSAILDAVPSGLAATVHVRISRIAG